MAPHKTIPICAKCGRPMKAAYHEMPGDYFGDTFSRWVHDGECIHVDNIVYNQVDNSTEAPHGSL